MSSSVGWSSLHLHTQLSDWKQACPPQGTTRSGTPTTSNQEEDSHTQIVSKHRVPNQLHSLGMNTVDLLSTALNLKAANATVVQESLRKKVIEGCHTAHQGHASKSSGYSILYITGSSTTKTIGNPWLYLLNDCGWLLHSHAKTWLVLSNRFTGWVSVLYLPKEASAKQLITIVRVICTTFGVAENVATDDGSQFRANEVGSTPQNITHTQILGMKRVSRLLRCYWCPINTLIEARTGKKLVPGYVPPSSMPVSLLLWSLLRSEATTPPPLRLGDLDIIGYLYKLLNLLWIRSMRPLPAPYDYLVYLVAGLGPIERKQPLQNEVPHAGEHHLI